MAILNSSIRNTVKKLAKTVGIDISYLRMEKAYKDQKKLTENKINPVVFDCGASVGQTTAKYLNLHPASRIYAFEPFPESLAAFTARIKNERVSTHQLAVSDTDGDKTLYINDLRYANSLLPLTEEMQKGKNSSFHFKADGSKTVRTVRIDTFCRERKIEKIDILKFDIQGGELAALKGATKLLSQKKIGLIYTEIWFTRAYEGQPLYDELCTFLAQFGYIPYSLYNVHEDKAGNRTDGDAIFIPKV